MRSEGEGRSLERPRTLALPAALRAAATGIAGRLRDAGRRGWICGGAVRDLALGRTPREVDMASDAPPDEIERLFPWTLAVGKAFGTVLVRWPGEPGAEPVAIELTTFRSESGYSDARRPDAVAFGATPEEDARRRDFTCNALFLDPLDDTLLDPEHGLADLAAGRLACVGDPGQRFAEDGLRLLRLARLAGALGLEPAPETLIAARGATRALAGVSPERVLDELGKLLARPGAAHGLALYAAIGIAGPVLDPLAEDLLERRVAELGRLAEPVGVERGLALLLGEPAVARAALERLRASRALVRGVLERVELAAELERLATPGGVASRAARVRALRQDAFDDAVAIAIARAASEKARAALERLAVERRAASRDELFPAPWIGSQDLARAGLARGPAWGTLLAEAETAQLDGRFADRATALEWLAGRVRAVQDGGKTPRST